MEKEYLTLIATQLECQSQYYQKKFENLKEDFEKSQQNMEKKIKEIKLEKEEKMKLLKNEIWKKDKLIEESKIKIGNITEEYEELKNLNIKLKNEYKNDKKTENSNQDKIISTLKLKLRKALKDLQDEKHLNDSIINNEPIKKEIEQKTHNLYHEMLKVERKCFYDKEQKLKDEIDNLKSYINDLVLHIEHTQSIKVAGENMDEDMTKSTIFIDGVNNVSKMNSDFNQIVLKSQNNSNPQNCKK